MARVQNRKREMLRQTIISNNEGLQRRPSPKKEIQKIKLKSNPHAASELVAARKRLAKLIGISPNHFEKFEITVRYKLMQLEHNSPQINREIAIKNIIAENKFSLMKVGNVFNLSTKVAYDGTLTQRELFTEIDNYLEKLTARLL